MAKQRSPNYPNHDLPGALALAAKVYEKDGRNKVSRATIATHLGHEVLSGPALGKLGAMRAYGLIEGSGDELRLTEDAIAAIKAPVGSEERKSALGRLAQKPVLFQLIRQEYPTPPSRENLSFWLEMKQGFTGAAASIAASTYLATIAFLASLGDNSNPKAPPNGEDHVMRKPPSEAPAKERHVAKTMENERELTTGLLSKNASFRLIVSGEVGVKEIERLIAKLELDKEILADPDGEDAESE